MKWFSDRNFTISLGKKIRMKIYLIYFTFVAAGTFVTSFPIRITNKEDCRCLDNYEARNDPKSGYKCYGLVSKVISNCNTIRRPKCLCTDPTGVLTDATGTWCTEYRSGREIRRWSCENRNDWEAFFTQYPDERFPRV
ncbi:uncharacterized protein LOC130900931 [Diorhabda carinulata]|uniref:uncharacterized protein LOC130900931 n=1 Tax=Diorhabda carinulata TaxID=1163345 RepID=UPI0025A236D0|nr:uncharacterized protein LOC130900931 [Diorhabda carinulata]